MGWHRKAILTPETLCSYYHDPGNAGLGLRNPTNKAAYISVQALECSTISELPSHKIINTAQSSPNHNNSSHAYTATEKS
jgi:hypothetical protein